MDEVIRMVRENIFKFLIIWFFIFLGSFLILRVFGLVPETEESLPEVEPPTISTLDQKLENISPSLPERVVIDEISVDVLINNPQSRSIDVLDDSLLTGAVRYPSSGLLGEKTNILLFGHSSNLPVVRNTNFRAFNKLNKLEQGDRISVYSLTHEFIYEVRSVEEADAQNALVVFESNKREITLSTCNTFGNLDDRFVVRADLIDVREI
jgi:LPXTG-site transpeptidase (sortase) family protein